MRLIAFFLNLALLIGCTPLRTGAKVEKPYHDIEGYKKGEWILLAESKTKNWYYDPRTLKADSNDVMEFTMFWAPKSGAKPSLIKGMDPNEQKLKVSINEITEKNFEEPVFSDEFNTGAIGPFLQIIDCPAKYQLSERPVDQACDISALGGNVPVNLESRDAECWVPIKEKTAMLMIAGRICGRPMPLKKLRYYFLFQDGLISPPEAKKTLDEDSLKENIEEIVSPTFYDVFNNEYIIIDAKLDIREMKVLAQALSKKESNTRDYIFRANCQNKTGSLYLPGKEVAEMAMISSPTSLIGVAFDRICGNHPDYMKEVKKYSN